jgi:hypothetical protein
MTVTIIVPAGEVRTPKKGDLFKDDKGKWVYAAIDFSDYGQYPIGITHEIEVPENVTYLIPTWCSSTYGVKDAIPLPRPKVYTKKWQWVMKDGSSVSGAHITCGAYTLEEFLNDWSPKGWYHKIDETMIEVSDE